ncbi:hypothetical protein RHOFW104T7_04925 [Rhodanobacter thiooxydans]|uniref:Uncharacterized protein n=1 Tax=Rhodanobacter thiooxydans TaxID=416169 RepID=A0A154QLG8_9GAMM|nr:hypothetical protein [Rhodanobacter thiooxydans]EIL96678.1 hypothetical protein UUA_17200 [Rhodanobacter thiooxydans LCS2]KZC25137.1 hypothetical protein RHOFW104T7_04925 [Rhodanobacter thiooxydans]MCW0203519.1 hypothetical protein [Rhodanobacter thiooxydans]
MPTPADIAQLGRSLRKLQIVTGALSVAVVMLAATAALQRYRSLDTNELRTHRIVVLDANGTKRIEIGQDAPNADRRARSAGIWMFDDTGHERGGMSTFADGSATMALDAPAGVGSQSVRDRLGLRVDADGSAQLLLTDNQTRGIVRLLSDGNGGGGVQTFKWDMAGKQIHVRTTTFDGDERTLIPIRLSE